VYLVWQITVRLTHSARRSAWCAILFAFSAQWWKFSTDANAYIPAIFFLLVCLRLLLEQRPRPIAAGLAHSAAMMFHQLSLFFFPAAFVGFLLQQRSPDGEGERRRGVILATKYLIAAVSMTGAAYLASFALVRPYLGALRFWNWITVHSEDAVFAWDPVQNLRLSLRGTFRLFFGGRVNQLKPDFVTVAGALAFGATLVLLVRYFMCWRRFAVQGASEPAPAGSPAADWSACVWALCYVVFLFFWLPQNTFYRLFYLPPLIFVVATLPAWRARRIQLLVLLAAAVCAWNFTVIIYPHSRAEANEVLAFALQHNKDWPLGSDILYSHSHSDLWIIRYFNPQATWIPEPSIAVARFESRRLDCERKGRQLWLEGTAYDAIATIPEGMSWLGRHVDPDRSLLHITPAHRIRYYRLK
jgi:hypothetical protein